MNMKYVICNDADTQIFMNDDPSSSPLRRPSKAKSYQPDQVHLGY